MSYGLDYVGGKVNIDTETGIRYGVIPSNDITQAWAESSEADYGPPTCPKCGNEARPVKTRTEHSDPPGQWVSVVIDEEFPEGWEEEGMDYVCEACKLVFDDSEAYGDEPLGWYVDDGEYEASCDSYGNVFILKSPYYTYGPFCCPCAPGAIYLRDGEEPPEPLPSGERLSSWENRRAYCFDPEWFDAWEDAQVTGVYNGNKTSCPYPVYRVSDGVCVFKPNQ
jgi:hypothetical protein